MDFGQPTLHSEGCVRAVYGAVHGPDLRWGRTEDDLYPTLPEALEALKSAGSADWVRQVYGDEVAIHAWEPVCLDAEGFEYYYNELESKAQELLQQAFGDAIPDISAVVAGRLISAFEAAVLEVPYANRAHVQTGTVIVDLAEAQARGWL